eukprot:6210241-Pleurochrysis_carterae.AAC.3
MQSAQAITADFLDLTESPQRVELIAKKGNKSLHIRSLSELEVGAEYVTERGNKLVRCSPDEAVLAGKVRLPMKCPANKRHNRCCLYMSCPTPLGWIHGPWGLSYMLSVHYRMLALIVCSQLASSGFRPSLLISPLLHGVRVRAFVLLALPVVSSLSSTTAEQLALAMGIPTPNIVCEVGRRLPWAS